MKDWITLLLVYLLVTMLVLFCSWRAHAADCGGAVSCSCGDVVTDDYTLTGNLTCSSGNGLTISNLVSGKTLNCNSFDITLSPAWANGNSDKYGIYLNGVTGQQVQGWTIKNCNVVTGFRVGIRLKEASYNTLLSNVVQNNGDTSAKVGYGVEITQNSNYNVLTSNTIDGCGDECFHGSYDDHTLWSGNVIKNAQRENCYFFHTSNASMTNDDCGAAADSSTTSLYCKGCQNNTFTGVDFINKVVHVTGAAIGNVWTNGTMTNFRLDEYEQVAGDQSSYSFPQNNTLSGVAITPAASTTPCLRIENAVATTVSGGSLNTCATKLQAATVDSAGITYKPTDVTFVNLDPFAGTNSVSADGGVTVNVAFSRTIHVQTGGAVAIPDAEVSLINAAGQSDQIYYTNSNGDTDPIVIVIANSTKPIKLTPHRLLVNKSGYYTNSQDVTVSSTGTTTVTMTAQ